MTEKQINIEDLVQDDHNFNRGTEEGAKLIEKSFQDHGAGRSVLLDKDNRLIAGNKATKGAIAAGIKKVRIIETTGDELIAVKRTDVSLDSKEGREMAMLDNLTTQVNMSWDKVELETVAEQVQGFDVSQFGFDIDSLPQAQPASSGGGSGTKKEAKEDDFDDKKDEIHVRCKPGDVWELGNHRLMCGDSIDLQQVKTLMGGVKSDLLITDPPYGVAIGSKNKLLQEKVGGSNQVTEDIKNDTLSVDELYKILQKAMENGRINSKDDASYFVFSPPGGDMGLMMMMMMRDAGLAVRHQLVWNKNAATFSLGRLDYDYKHEAIMYTWTKTHHNYREGQFRNTVWDVDKPLHCDLHPTMKPIPLLSAMMLDCSKEGDVILDLFGGSGSTMIAAEQLDRKAYLMELDPHYCDVILARWEKFTGKTATKVQPQN